MTAAAWSQGGVRSEARHRCLLWGASADIGRAEIGPPDSTEAV
jgi:hypothetical protein